jgi:hypothetical protein
VYEFHRDETHNGDEMMPEKGCCFHHNMFTCYHRDVLRSAVVHIFSSAY